MSRHQHRFHGLWWTLGQYGRQDVHLHPCESERCTIELVGERCTTGCQVLA